MTSRQTPKRRFPYDPKVACTFCIPFHVYGFRKCWCPDSTQNECESWGWSLSTGILKSPQGILMSTQSWRTHLVLGERFKFWYPWTWRNRPSSMAGRWAIWLLEDEGKSLTHLLNQSRPNVSSRGPQAPSSIQLSPPSWNWNSTYRCSCRHLESLQRPNSAVGRKLREWKILPQFLLKILSGS